MISEHCGCLQLLTTIILQPEQIKATQKKNTHTKIEDGWMDGRKGKVRNICPKEMSTLLTLSLLYVKIYCAMCRASVTPN